MHALHRHIALKPIMLYLARVVATLFTIFAIIMSFPKKALAYSNSHVAIESNTSFRIHTNAANVPEQPIFRGAGYFDQLDATLSDSNGSRPVVAAHRFIRLAARVSVFAFYCDDGNKLKLSQSVSKFRAKTVTLEKAAEKNLGGEIPAYNEFEDARNEESLTFASIDDLDPICQQNMSKFRSVVASTSAKLGADLSTAAFGTR